MVEIAAALKIKISGRLQIPPNSQGLIEYRSHPFWNQKYCPSHEKDGRKRCCSCDRIEVWWSLPNIYSPVSVESSLSATTVFRDCIIVCSPFVGTSDSTDNFCVGSDQELSHDPVNKCDDSWRLWFQESKSEVRCKSYKRSSWRFSFSP